MKSCVLTGIVLCLTTLAFPADIVSQTNVTVFQRTLMNALDVPCISAHDMDRLRDLPLKRHLEILEEYDPLSTNVNDLGWAEDVITMLGRRCFTQADVASVRSSLSILRDRWSGLDPGDDPATRAILRNLPTLLDFAIAAAATQLSLGERLRVLHERRESSQVLIFRVAGFDPAIRAVNPSAIDLLVSASTPVGDSLLPYGKPVPFSQQWSPDEYAWRDVAMQNAYHAKVLIFLNRDEPLLYVILLGNELWIAPCGDSSSPCAFSFGPNPPQVLYDALKNIFDHDEE